MVASMVIGLTIGITAFHKQQPDVPAAAERLTQVLQQIDRSYVTEVSETELMDGALHGLMKGLDPHSVYLDATEYGDLQADTTGHFGGVGIQLGLVDGFFTVISPIDHTPAARAGLKTGDIVVAVNGEPVIGVKLKDLVTKLRGEPGTDVSLAVRRGETKSKTYELTRAVIEVDSVTSEMLDGNIGYLRISQFQMNTATEVDQAVKRLQFESGENLNGLVLDLRNNPGGILQQSVAVADSFLTNGLIVYTAGRQRSSKLRFSASGDDAVNGAPLAVLINRGSASASEIVAGALQDHDRALVIGSQSFGKGSVQSVVPVSEREAIKLTTALYYTPSGRSIHNKGITPDVSSDLVGDALIQFAAERLAVQTPPLHASKVD